MQGVGGGGRRRGRRPAGCRLFWLRGLGVCKGGGSPTPSPTEELAQRCPLLMVSPRWVAEARKPEEVFFCSQMPGSRGGVPGLGGEGRG